MGFSEDDGRRPAAVLECTVCPLFCVYYHTAGLIIPRIKVVAGEFKKVTTRGIENSPDGWFTLDFLYGVLKCWGRISEMLPTGVLSYPGNSANSGTRGKFVSLCWRYINSELDHFS